MWCLFWDWLFTISQLLNSTTNILTSISPHLFRWSSTLRTYLKVKFCIIPSLGINLKRAINLISYIPQFMSFRMISTRATIWLSMIQILFYWKKLSKMMRRRSQLKKDKLYSRNSSQSTITWLIWSIASLIWDSIQTNLRWWKSLRSKHAKIFLSSLASNVLSIINGEHTLKLSSKCSSTGF